MKAIKSKRVGIFLLPNLGYYVQAINDIVTGTETLGEEMNAKYEIVRKAIDDDQLAALSAAELAEILAAFEAGTAKYQANAKKIKGLRPPAKVMGIHKKFQHQYEVYVEGCVEMIESLVDGTVNVPAFNAAEAKQDQASDEISMTIQKMTQMLMR